MERVGVRELERKDGGSECARMLDGDTDREISLVLRVCPLALFHPI